jgi:hypothetical protein
MAKANNNVLMEGLSGKLGQLALRECFEIQV